MMNRVRDIDKTAILAGKLTMQDLNTEVWFVCGLAELASPCYSNAQGVLGSSLVSAAVGGYSFTKPLRALTTSA